MRRFLCLCLAVLVLIAASSLCAEDWMWAKGSLHTHSTNSDGDSSPQAVADWYREHGYQFLVISDHFHITDYTGIDTGPDGNFVLVHGEESGVLKSDRPIHANSMGTLTRVKAPEAKATRARSVATLVERIREAGGIPMVNHPSWRWSLTHRELLAVRGPYLLEIANMSRGCNNEGSMSWMSTEQTWDVLLSNGQTVYATATDDMHTLGAEPAGPGKGWVVARVPELTYKAILDALSKGEFYASIGVELADYSFDGREFKIRVNPKADTTYLIRFVGKWGEILQETVGTSASYKFTGKAERNSYVRCKVIASDDTVAWTQAYRIKD